MFSQHDKKMLICRENIQGRKRFLKGRSGNQTKEREEELWVDWVEGRIMGRKKGIATCLTTMEDFCTENIQSCLGMCIQADHIYFQI